MATQGAVGEVKTEDKTKGGVKTEAKPTPTARSPEGKEAASPTTPPPPSSQYQGLGARPKTGQGVRPEAGQGQGRQGGLRQEADENLKQMTSVKLVMATKFEKLEDPIMLIS